MVKTPESVYKFSRRTRSVVRVCARTGVRLGCQCRQGGQRTGIENLPGIGNASIIQCQQGPGPFRTVFRDVEEGSGVKEGALHFSIVEARGVSADPTPAVLQQTGMLDAAFSGQDLRGQPGAAIGVREPTAGTSIRFEGGRVTAKGDEPTSSFRSL